MSAEEMHRWALYRKKYGPMNSMLRLDAALARAAAPFMGRNVKASDLMPWPDKSQDELTPESVMAVLTGVKR
jgi:hypothetical protein